MGYNSLEGPGNRTEEESPSQWEWRNSSSLSQPGTKTALGKDIIHTHLTRTTTLQAVNLPTSAAARQNSLE